jgi:methyl-accepting chemotaxis protein
MVQAFARVADGLSTLASQAEMAAPTHAGASAVDEVIAARPDMVEELLQPMRRAVQQRDEAARALTEGAESLRQLDRAAKECKALARHTRMVATNASIEAKRHGGHGNAQEQRGRFDAVAAEIRTLGDRSAELGEQLQRALADLTRQFEPLRRHAELHDITEDELHLEARIQARKVLAGLMTDLGRSLQASHEMRALATQMRDDVDAVFLGFQAGDRVGQMLDILERDVRKLIDWNATRASASHADADAWLAELEQSYTMTEQRNQHHNTVSVDTDAGVEFF